MNNKYCFCGGVIPLVFITFIFNGVLCKDPNETISFNNDSYNLMTEYEKNITEEFLLEVMMAENSNLEEDKKIDKILLDVGMPGSNLTELDDSSEPNDNNATIRDKRTLGILGRFYCTIFYRNSPSTCPIAGQRSDNTIQSSYNSANSDIGNDLWLNYLGNDNNNTDVNGTEDQDGIYIPPSTSSYYSTTTSRPQGIFNIILNTKSRAFRTLFPRLSSTVFGGPSGTNNGDGTRPSLWSRLVGYFTRIRDFYRRVRGGVRGFRDGYRNSDNSDTYTPRGSDVSGLFNSILT